MEPVPGLKLPAAFLAPPGVELEPSAEAAQNEVFIEALTALLPHDDVEIHFSKYWASGVKSRMPEGLQTRTFFRWLKDERPSMFHGVFAMIMWAEELSAFSICTLNTDADEPIDALFISPDFVAPAQLPTFADLESNAALGGNREPVSRFTRLARNLEISVENAVSWYKQVNEHNRNICKKSRGVLRMGFRAGAPYWVKVKMRVISNPLGGVVAYVPADASVPRYVASVELGVPTPCLRVLDAGKPAVMLLTQPQLRTLNTLSYDYLTDGSPPSDADILLKDGVRLLPEAFAANQDNVLTWVAWAAVLGCGGRAADFLIKEQVTRPPGSIEDVIISAAFVCFRESMTKPKENDGTASGSSVSSLTDPPSREPGVKWHILEHGNLERLVREADQTSSLLGLLTAEVNRVLSGTPTAPRGAGDERRRFDLAHS